MATTATGNFEVKLAPQAPAEGDTSGIGRMALDKTFTGDLSGTSSGQMLAFSTTTAGSAGYVAMETVVGRIGERAGSFVLQHTGTMNRGTPTLSVTVVPDSGTGDLVGITGTLQIDITAEGHRYTFTYTLPAQEN